MPLTLIQTSFMLLLKFLLFNTKVSLLKGRGTKPLKTKRSTGVELSICSQKTIDQSCLNGLWLEQSVWKAKEVKCIGPISFLEPIN